MRATFSLLIRLAATRGLRATSLLALLVAVLFHPGTAQARTRSVIYDWRAPVDYDLELEPHLVFGTEPPGAGYGSGVGIGFRGSAVIAPRGFIDRINDSVAIGFGLDYGHYTAAWSLNGYRDQCLQFVAGPNGTSVCVDVTSNGGSYNYLYVPFVMQWNFWLANRFSAFGEPGLDVYYVGHYGWSLGPAFYVGGRFLITDSMAVTLRLGYPTSSLGASFLF